MRIIPLSSLLLYCLLSGLWGCVSTKPVVYFQNSADTTSFEVPRRFIPTLQAGDVLSVQVSSLNPEASTFFNPYSVMSAGADRNQVQPYSTTPLPYASGYLVGQDGTIELPLAGKIAVQGLTTAQATERIREALRKYLKEPVVNVRNLNFKVSVLGEVTRPSLFNVPNEQITLLEALSLAGDITIFGRRTNILVIREENGRQTFARVDLTGRDLFRSPYFYLHPNDVVYVEPSKNRVASVERGYQLAPTIIAALSFLAIIVTQVLR